MHQPPFMPRESSCPADSGPEKRDPDQNMVRPHRMLHISTIRALVVRVGKGRPPFLPDPNGSNTGVHFPSKECDAYLQSYGTEIMLPPKARELARRLLADEGVAGKTEPADFAAFRVCETLRRPICALVGVAGFHPLLSRALTLAKAEALSLSAVEIAADGSVRRLDEHGLQIDEDQSREAEEILIAHLLGVLFLVIGEALASRLVTLQVLPHRGFLPKNVSMGFDAILTEVDQLQGVSTRLDGLAEQHPSVTEALMTIAGSVRNVASVLGVLVAIRSPKPN